MGLYDNGNYMSYMIKETTVTHSMIIISTCNFMLMMQLNTSVDKRISDSVLIIRVLLVSHS